MSSETRSPSLERRAQARLHVQLPVQIQCYGEDHPRRAILLDLSWGGALCQTAGSVPQTTQPLYLWLPWEGDEKIQIETCPLRQKSLGIGRYLVALRFRRLSLSDQNRLEKLLGKLLEERSASQQLETQPLVATIEVEVKNFPEWRSALSHIAAGQLLVTAASSFLPGQSIGLRFNGVPQRARLRLRARVLNCEPNPTPEGMPTYLLTLEFEHPEEALRNWAEWLLKQVPPTAVGQQGAGQPMSAPGVVQGQVVPLEVNRSALEVGFPEATNYLVAAWGDPEAFDIVFRQLIFGESGTTETWTPEAWEELQFLQSLHEQVYGVSEGRRLMLRITGQEPF